MRSSLTRGLIAPMVALFAFVPALETAAYAGIPTSTETSATPSQPDSTVSDTYAAPGADEVIATAVTGYQLFYPSDVATDGEHHPLITFGNGSYATFEQYEALLRHLASWGFVVVVADSSVTGDGQEILAAARYVVDENINPDSIFHNAINVESIASVGHSQGAGGAINAATHSEGLISSTAVLDLPDPWWASRPIDVVDVTRLGVPVFFMAGADDPVSTSLAQSNYYNASPTQAALGRLRGVGHNWASDGEGFRGYLTAWLKFTLSEDPFAATAFTGESPALLSDSDWDQQSVKG
ncbi:poly(ethylene terephthalate) hydrolase family protein [Rhodococcus sp. OK302]|uniref:poly(ethylene terephthalate) hydrolase family protein n=1 Tax=Rhodococcus sp. OK302 TaxID=1882769 RepID=UPI000B94349F|nr:alpha/beta hydrolase [Rhodococcus sp. OK302]OYD61189.1 chlorophyllase-like protein [Rhodococcus sp. OK302]